MLSKVVRIGAKEYTFELTAAAHKRVKTLADISLPDCVHDVSGVKEEETRKKALDLFNAVISDFDRLPRVIFAMLHPQLKENGITTQEQLDEVLDGPAFENCGYAITQALIDFFHHDPRGRLLANAVEMAMKAAKVQEAWDQKSKERMDLKLTEISEKIKSSKGSDAVDGTIREMLTNLSTTLPGSLGSILAPSP